MQHTGYDGPNFTAFSVSYRWHKQLQIRDIYRQNIYMCIHVSDVVRVRSDNRTE